MRAASIGKDPKTWSPINTGYSKFAAGFVWFVRILIALIIALIAWYVYKHQKTLLNKFQ